MAKPQSKRQIMWDLFARGFEPNSPETKGTGVKYDTRLSYYRRWEKAERPGYIGYDIEAAASRLPQPRGVPE